MPAHKHCKQLVRARMSKTGESCSTARRQVMRQSTVTPPDPAAGWHFPGNIPATTALRVVVTHAGLRAPHTGLPYSEAMLFGIAGGIGAGIFSFVYDKADFASFFIAGRHNWQDDAGYSNDAFRRLGVTPKIRNTAGAKVAAGHLKDALAEGPCVAWVDMVHLPHRGLPAIFNGGGYHVITVHRIDEEAGTATIGDLADEPITMALDDLARARGRIKKQQNRLLSVAEAPGSRDLTAMVREGLKSCHEGRPGIGAKVMVNFTLEAFRVWGHRMQGSRDKESWERIFPRGGRLWRGLTSIHDHIEHHGTGGGLCRLIFAEFLSEAAEATGNGALRDLAGQYQELGRRWSELAEAALPDSVPAFREAKQLMASRSELITAGGGKAAEEARETWGRLDELAAEARQEFPLSEAECRELRADLQVRIRSLYDVEIAAQRALGAAATAC
jgi:hypothetical protein